MTFPGNFLDYVNVFQQSDLNKCHELNNRTDNFWGGCFLFSLSCLTERPSNGQISPGDRGVIPPPLLLSLLFSHFVFFLKQKGAGCCWCSCWILNPVHVNITFCLHDVAPNSNKNPAHCTPFVSKLFPLSMWPAQLRCNLSACMAAGAHHFSWAKIWGWGEGGWGRHWKDLVSCTRTWRPLSSDVPNWTVWKPWWSLLWITALSWHWNHPWGLINCPIWQTDTVH